MDAAKSDIAPPLDHLDDEPAVCLMRRLIRYAARVLAALMVLVIWWGVADVVSRPTTFTNGNSGRGRWWWCH